MKLLTTIVSTLILILPLQAKMASTVEISNIRKISLTENEITIIGDALFTSFMVTSKEKKNSNSTIMGKPAAQYTADGRSVKFTITPYSLKLSGNLTDEEQANWKKVRNEYTKFWQESTQLAKGLKKGDSVTISIQGDSVNFMQGSLTSVEGSGHLHPTP
ncbi:hypothetical protein ACFPK9_00535 [Rubritalea spongiae]|uniref:Lipopolysaccharide transport periplasmic protein LptA n=1 Tax=Rubritalea spongiae TaxID=430797 RepID=A0ABW5E7K6_9BACT